MRWISFAWRKAHASGPAVLAGLALVCVILAPGGATAAYTQQVLYRFCAQSNCTDGSHPQAGLLMDSAGNLYGTTYDGGTNWGTYGASYSGVVFELGQTSSGWQQKVLHSFGQVVIGSFYDGAYPEAGVIMDGAGNLYGTTYNGTGSEGVIYRLTPSGSSWTEKIAWPFCYGCYTGDEPIYPAAGLIVDAAGNFYGTGTHGGTNCLGTYTLGCGAAYKLSPSSSGFTLSTLYSFCSLSNCADGQSPYSTLVMDKAGNLYGTTALGGNSANAGVVFKLTPSGNAWTETVLYRFCSQTNCADGASPYSGLIFDNAGNLYGTTKAGGSTVCSGGCGVVFKLAPASSGWTYSPIHTFCSQNSNCADGAFPQAGLIMDAAENFHGTTYNGGTGTNRQGTVFKLTPNTSGWTETVLYNFCSQSSCADGANPAASLIMDGAGNLYGTTVHGGNSNNAGVVFALGPASATLSASVVGNAGSKVTSSPSGIDCGSTCSASFAAGSQVTLTATPASGWSFGNWGGACNGPGGCSLTMNSAQTVLGTFWSIPFAFSGLPAMPNDPTAPLLPPP